MTGFASTLSATSAASARACAASVVARSSSKYLPCRTSATPPYPSECRASAMVLPCGSKTDGFSVTKTRARMSDDALDAGKNPLEDRVDVLELFAQLESAVDLCRREHAGNVGIRSQQGFEVALLGERQHGV